MRWTLPRLCNSLLARIARSLPRCCDSLPCHPHHRMIAREGEKHRKRERNTCSTSCTEEELCCFGPPAGSQFFLNVASNTNLDWFSQGESPVYPLRFPISASSLSLSLLRTLYCSSMSFSILFAHSLRASGESQHPVFGQLADKKSLDLCIKVITHTSPNTHPHTPAHTRTH